MNAIEQGRNSFPMVDPEVVWAARDLLRHPGAQSFWDTYNSIPANELSHVVIHDVRAQAAFLLGSYELMDTRYKRPQHKASFDNLWAAAETPTSDSPKMSPTARLNTLLTSMGAFIDENYTVLCKHPPKELIGQFHPEYSELFAALSDSARFLSSPNPVDYASLVLRRVKLTTITDMYNISLGKESRESVVPGDIAVILTNLCQNAQRNAIDGTRPTLSIYPDRLDGDLQWMIEVINDSEQALPDKTDIFAPGVRGVNGNTGFGLTIARMYTNLGGMDLIGRQGTHWSDMCHQVFFHLMKVPGEWIEGVE